MQNVLTVDNEVNEETFGLDLSAVGPRTALLPQFFQDQPLRVQKCKSSQPDGWESTSVEFKGICNTCFCGDTPPTGKLWITKSGLELFPDSQLSRALLATCVAILRGINSLSRCHSERNKFTQ